MGQNQGHLEVKRITMGQQAKEL